jgi:ribonucleoside-diphosphate reductase alpha chain
MSVSPSSPLPSSSDSRRRIRRARRAPKVRYERSFSRAGVHPYDELRWESRIAAITSDSGKIIFEQKDVEVPSGWSQLATNVVVSKYFRGAVGHPGREHSVKQLVSRVVDTITGWGRDLGYFASESDVEAFSSDLCHLLVNQFLAFNSPVWFNVGIEKKPQCSACFINSVEDTLESILELAKTEGMLFKYGSGAGSNLSKLRSSREMLSTGGKPSGPVSFMRGYDAFANVIKSGGKTRRAAKMQILDCDHPDVEEFIWCKAHEEKKAHALIDAGYDGSVNGEAYQSVFFQNSNLSVRVTDDFMRAVEADGMWTLLPRTAKGATSQVRARDLYRQICEAAWKCGDPGVQYDDTINRWHTCKGTDRIYASNPCVTGDTLVATAGGWRRIDSLLLAPAEVVGADGRLHRIAPAFPTGVKPVYRLRTRAGFELRLTADHRVLTANRGDVQACELTRDDVLVLGRPSFGTVRIEEDMAEVLGLMVGDGCLMGDQRTAMLTLAPGEEAVARRAHAALDRFRKENAADARAARDIEVTNPQGTLRLGTSARCVVEFLDRHAVLDGGSLRKAFREEVFHLDRASAAAVLRGLFTADGTVANYGEKSQYVSLESVSSDLLRQAQLLLLGFGIKAKVYRDRRPLGQTTALLPDGKGGRKEYPVEQIHSLRVSRSSRVLFEREIGFVAGSPKVERLAGLNREVGSYADRLEDRVESLEFAGEEPVFDLTEAETSHFVAAGLVVHNCSEYMFLDDTACNLASLNLLKFRNEDGSFDEKSFRAACRTSIIAQEIIVDSASYPTPRIGEMSHRFRTLGLGYANLGALLMAEGLPYDSDAGRAYAAAVTALMTGEGYRTSAELSAAMGPFPGYAENEDAMLGVIAMHRDAAYALPRGSVPDTLLAAARGAWDEALELGREHGYRNAQTTVLAPTGTIAFMMDCDTTGVEPDIALVKYKKLVGGGVLKIVNRTVPPALEKLGYTPAQIAEIIDHIDRTETIEGAPGLKDEHLPVFDCAFRARNGVRSIAAAGHVRMMAATQPFLSGAISKTVNLPPDATVEEIGRIYMEGWKLGLKAIAIYRDGCKRIQPLSTSKEEKAQSQKIPSREKVVAETPKPAETVKPSETLVPRRRRLPDERRAITHKFSIGGHDGYLTIGEYDDGAPGEIFVVMAKEGSTVSGLMDSVATLTSIALQYGVPADVLVNKFSHTRFEPSGMTTHADIRFAKSPVDYIFRYMGLKYVKPKDAYEDAPAAAAPGAAALDTPAAAGAVEDAGQNGGPNGGANGGNGHGNGGGAQAQAPAVAARSLGAAALQPVNRLAKLEERVFNQQSDAPSCHNCGGIMTRNGSCYKCGNCGETSGCS